MHDSILSLCSCTEPQKSQIISTGREWKKPVAKADESTQQNNQQFHSDGSGSKVSQEQYLLLHVLWPSPKLAEALNPNEYGLVPPFADAGDFPQQLASLSQASKQPGERERQLLVKDLNALDTHGRKVANTFSEFTALLEVDATTDVIPKQVVIQLLTTLSESIISMCEATRNVSMFINLSSAGIDGDVSRKVSSAMTSEPVLSSRVTPGEVRTVRASTSTPTLSVITEASKKMTVAEIRRCASAVLLPVLLQCFRKRRKGRGASLGRPLCLLLPRQFAPLHPHSPLCKRLARRILGPSERSVQH